MAQRLVGKSRPATGFRPLQGLVWFLIALCWSCGGTANEALVQRIVDGDTITLTDGRKVRYIGIDTPESDDPRPEVQLLAKEATELNRQLVEGRKIRLEYDQDRTDRYGRTLAYVYVGETFVNAELVKLGYADVLLVPPNDRHRALFDRLRDEARQDHRGAWGEGGFPARMRD